MSIRVGIIGILTLYLAGPGEVNGQSLWLKPKTGSSIAIEWDRPVFNKNRYGFDIYTALSSTLFLTTRIAIANNTTLEFDIPISHTGVKPGRLNPYGISQLWSEETKTSLGNMYAGAELRVLNDDETSLSMIRIGLRLPSSRWLSPLSDDLGLLTGRMSEIDRAGAFHDGFLTFRAIISHAEMRMTSSGELVAQAEGGINQFFSIFNDTGSNKMFLNFQYAIQIRYHTDRFIPMLGISGINPFMNQDTEFRNDGIIHGRAGLILKTGMFSTGFVVRLPVTSSYATRIPASFGLTFNYDF